MKTGGAITLLLGLAGVTDAFVPPQIATSHQTCPLIGCNSRSFSNTLSPSQQRLGTTATARHHMIVKDDTAEEQIKQASRGAPKLIPLDLEIAPPVPPPLPKKEKERVEKEKSESEVTLNLQVDTNDVLAFAGRALDTFEDALLHLKRAIEPVRTSAQSSKNNPKAKLGSRQRIVVLGVGWGGHAFSKVIDSDKFEVVFVAPRNCFIFTPMLAGASVGTVELRSITESIKEANPHALYVPGKATFIDVKSQVVMVDNVKTGDTLELEYSYLVYAVGGQIATFGIPGVMENCYALKELTDVIRLRKALLDCFDQASLPGLSEDERRKKLAFVVIGSGPTGIEFCGELSDMLHSDVPRLFPELVPYISMTLLSADGSILTMFNDDLKGKGTIVLGEQDVKVMLNTKVTEVTKDEIFVEGGKTVPYSICLWAGGVAPRSLTKKVLSEIPEQVNLTGAKRGQLTIDPWMRVIGTNGTVLGIGDAVRFNNSALPMTGQVAGQEGAYVARLLNRGYNLSTTEPEMNSVSKPTFELELVTDFVALRGDLKARPFHFLNLGILAYVGGGEALAQVQAGDKTKLLDASGAIGFLLWRSVYVVKQVSTKTRILVLLDWMLTKTFGRDFTKFDD